VTTIAPSRAGGAAAPSPRAAFVRLAAVLAALALAAVAARFLGAGEALAGLAAHARALGGAGMALHALAYVPAGLVGLPLVPLTIAAGVAWGTLAGAAVALAGTVVASCVAFGAGRLLVARDPELLTRGEGRIARAARGLGANGFRSVLLLRLVPLTPFCVLNHALGATPCRLRDFGLATLLGSIPGALVYAAAGALAAGGPG
jgi:uncharacterized membrane protein YdjX (TVP38/TMEM64 family)